MANFVEQRSTIKFCLQYDISAVKLFRMFRKAFSKSTMSKKNGYKWYKDFQEGRERVDDLKRKSKMSRKLSNWFSIIV